MIPKKIHYTRIGWNPMPELAIKCLKSWDKVLPEYELCLWDEKNFDFNICNYVKQAYQARKFAFVRDYIRIRSMYHFGWISMDTDVEVLKPLDRFLEHKWFSWFESKDIIPTGIMGFEKWHPLLKKLLEYYNSTNFLDVNWEPILYANTKLITDIANNEDNFTWGWDKKVVLKNDFHIYPESYFCPKNDYSILLKDSNCYTIHYFSGSWLPKRDQNYRKFYNIFINLFKKLHIYWIVSYIRRKYILKSA